MYAERREVPKLDGAMSRVCVCALLIRRIALCVVCVAVSSFLETATGVPQSCTASLLRFSGSMEGLHLIVGTGDRPLSEMLALVSKQFQSKTASRAVGSMTLRFVLDLRRVNKDDGRHLNRSAP